MITTLSGTSTTGYSCMLSALCVNTSTVTVYCCGSNNCNTAKSLEINNKLFTLSFILLFATLLLF